MTCEILLLAIRRKLMAEEQWRRKEGGVTLGLDLLEVFVPASKIFHFCKRRREERGKTQK